MKKPDVRVQQFDPTDFVIRANTEMFITNRQDWIFGWLETKEQSLQMAEKHLKELVNLQARRCPTWHRVLAGMMVYYPFFKWRRVFCAWFLTKVIIPFFLLVTFPLRWSFNKLKEWLDDNTDLVAKEISRIPQMLKLLLTGSGLFVVLFGLWVALDYGYYRDVADGAKTVATAVVIEAPLKVKASVVDWHSDRVRTELHAQQVRLERQRIIETHQKWEQENPIEAARLRAEEERKRLEELKREREATERKWEGRMLDALDIFKGIGMLILVCIGLVLAVGAIVVVFWLLAETIKPLQRFFNAVYEIVLTLIALLFIGFEKYIPICYRWTERSVDFVFIEFPILLRKGCSFVKYAWDWAWGKLCPALSVHGAQDMLQDVQAQLAQLRVQKNPPQTSPVPEVEEEEGEE